MRLANARNPMHSGELGFGYPVDLSDISIAEENIFFNYDDTRSAEIKFTLSSGNTLTLHFLALGSCVLTLDTRRGSLRNTSTVKREFKCGIGFVPILEPVEHREPLYQPEAVCRALFNYRAARNFRNIWHHYPEQFERMVRLANGLLKNGFQVCIASLGGAWNVRRGNRFLTTGLCGLRRDFLWVSSTGNGKYFFKKVLSRHNPEATLRTAEKRGQKFRVSRVGFAHWSGNFLVSKR